MTSVILVLLVVILVVNLVSVAMAVIVYRRMRETEQMIFEAAKTTITNQEGGRKWKIRRRED